MYEPKKFDHLLGVKGFSDTLLTNHFTLYEGYVKNTNKALELLAQYAKEEKSATPEYAELKRRFGWEWNGMRLHELYFGNLTKTAKPIAENLTIYRKVSEEWGSYEMWGKDFKSTGAMRGIGWVICAYDPIGKKIFNTWINEHDAGHLAGAIPLVVMDVFEHAYMLDYGLNKGDYINAFWSAVDWRAVDERIPA